MDRAIIQARPILDSLKSPQNSHGTPRVHSARAQGITAGSLKRQYPVVAGLVRGGGGRNFYSRPFISRCVVVVCIVFFYPSIVPSSLWFMAIPFFCFNFYIGTAKGRTTDPQKVSRAPLCPRVYETDNKPGRFQSAAKRFAGCPDLAFSSCAQG
jgi:hypothetical protein